MSNTERVKGTLRPTFKTPEEFAPGLTDDEFCDKFYETTVIINGKVFMVEKTDVDPFGHIEITPQSDGSYLFDAMWYNGGGSLDEVLENEWDRKKFK